MKDFRMQRYPKLSLQNMRSSFARLTRCCQRPVFSCHLRVLVVVLAVLGSWANLAVAGDGDPVYVVIKAGRVITATGDEFKPGIIVIEDGKITAVGGDLEYPPAAKVINARSQTVMPGFVHPRSRYKLPSYKRSGVHGDQSVSSEVYLEQMNFDDLLEAGYTTVCLVPDGKDMPGTATAYRTAGSKEQRTFDGPRYLQVRPNWSSTGTKMLRGALKKAKGEIEKVEKARKEWEEKQAEKKAKADAEKEKKDKDKPDEEKPEGDGGHGDKSRASRSAKRKTDGGDDGDPDKTNGEKASKTDDADDDEFKPPAIDPKYQPLVDLIQEKEGASLMIELGKASDLLHLDDVLDLYDDLPHTLFVKTRQARTCDFHLVVEKLGEQKAKVLLNPSINRMPSTTFRYNLAAQLAHAGCEVSIVPWSDSRLELRRARERLAELVRGGFDGKEAVKSMTLHPARAIGLDTQIGSIEKKKDADLVFLDGDPLDPHTKVTKVMILGEVVWDAAKDQ